MKVTSDTLLLQVKILGVVLIVIGLFGFWASIPDSKAENQVDKFHPDPVRSRTVFAHRSYLETVKHDGHWFVAARSDGLHERNSSLIHHPSCPCLLKAESPK